MMGSDLRYAVEVFKIVPPRPVFVAYLARCAERAALQRAMAIDEAGV
jgi:glutathione S-transferase